MEDTNRTFEITAIGSRGRKITDKHKRKELRE
jgi:hypothetical protein